MAENTQTEEEPSIEEILDSIRQIISEDDDEEEESSSSEVSEPVEEKESFSAPLDQSAVDDIDFDAPVFNEPEEEPEVELSSEVEEDILELTDRIDEGGAMDVDLRDQDDEPEPEVEAAPVVKDESDLFTNKVESAAVDAITQLVKKTAVERGGVTLEEIVRSELKPMLRDWLDRNLPMLIERLVSEELERVTNRLLED